MHDEGCRALEKKLDLAHGRRSLVGLSMVPGGERAARRGAGARRGGDAAAADCSLLCRGGRRLSRLASATARHTARVAEALLQGAAFGDARGKPHCAGRFSAAIAAGGRRGSGAGGRAGRRVACLLREARAVAARNRDARPATLPRRWPRPRCYSRPVCRRHRPGGARVAAAVEREAAARQQLRTPPDAWL